LSPKRILPLFGRYQLSLVLCATGSPRDLPQQYKFIAPYHLHNIKKDLQIIAYQPHQNQRPSCPLPALAHALFRPLSAPPGTASCAKPSPTTVRFSLVPSLLSLPIWKCPCGVQVPVSNRFRHVSYCAVSNEIHIKWQIPSAG